jgi:hypothetical protein
MRGNKKQDVMFYLSAVGLSILLIASAFGVAYAVAELLRLIL